MGLVSTKIQVRDTVVSDTNPFPVTNGTPTSTSAKSIAIVTASFNRPADTNNYAAGDVVTTATSGATLIELTNCAQATGRGGVLQNMTLWKTGTSVTGATFEVDFYSSSSATIPAQDNVAANVLVANAPYYVGTVAFVAMTTGPGASNTGARAFAAQNSLAYACAATSLYWVVRCTAAYTDEASGETFTLTAVAIRD